MKDAQFHCTALLKRLSKSLLLPLGFRIFSFLVDLVLKSLRFTAKVSRRLRDFPHAAASSHS